MSAFKFNFSCPSDVAESTGGDSTSSSATRKDDKGVNLLPGRQHELNDSVFGQLLAKKDDADTVLTVSCASGPSLSYFSSDSVVDLLKATTSSGANPGCSSELCAVMASSDLVSGVYEGGFKVWECAFDLALYIQERDDMNFDGKSVLELGCGAGLPGLACLQRNAKQVAFQDYNPEVIEYFTIPTLILNAQRDAANRTMCFSGDWAAVSDLLLSSRGQHTFDYVLSTETIYNTDTYQKLHDLLDNHLSPSGLALFGAKSYYFGVGGGVKQFTEFVTAKKVFSVSRTKEITSNVKREILELKRI